MPIAIPSRLAHSPGISLFVAQVGGFASAMFKLDGFYLESAKRMLEFKDWRPEDIQLIEAAYAADDLSCR